ncbi:hypothetical protein AN189_17115 [Loktanella sp. 3ANDIMAR09]|nr:hypothetical protein AN189_17115 [Loktanella sp. 3ANDIMAR09]
MLRAVRQATDCGRTAVPDTADFAHAASEYRGRLHRLRASAEAPKPHTLHPTGPQTCRSGNARAPRLPWPKHRLRLDRNPQVRDLDWPHPRRPPPRSQRASAPCSDQTLPSQRRSPQTNPAPHSGFETRRVAW